MPINSMRAGEACRSGLHRMGMWLSNSMGKSQFPLRLVRVPREVSSSALGERSRDSGGSRLSAC